MNTSPNKTRRGLDKLAGTYFKTDIQKAIGLSPETQRKVWILEKPYHPETIVRGSRITNKQYQQVLQNIERYKKKGYNDYLHNHSMRQIMDDAVEIESEYRNQRKQDKRTMIAITLGIAFMIALHLLLITNTAL